MTDTTDQHQDDERPATGLASHALVIGINDYTDGIAPLQSAVRDASAIARLLETEHRYRVTRLLDSAATKRAIIDFLADDLPPRLGEDSAVLVYYAGHGLARGDGSDGPQGYLLPYDARKADDDSWLSMSDLLEALERLPCRHLLVVLDCCFAGAFRWSATRDSSWDIEPLYASQYERYVTGHAWQALTSAASDELAADLIPGRHNRRDGAAGRDHSPFAAALLSGLSGNADSSRADIEADGVITATELHQYVREKLMPSGAAATQTPGIWPLAPTNKGEFVFRNPRAALNTRADPPLDDENNPWLGLTAYSMADSPLFYGRQRVVSALLEQTLASPTPALLAVVGASGTGKSSVVKAGLLPRLAAGSDADDERIGRWTIVSCARFTSNPEQQIADAERALDDRPGGSRALLFIDQFEELYTQCADPLRRTRVLERLRALVDRPDGATVLVTIRSDFEPRPAKEGALGELWEASRFPVPPFRLGELREIIEAPAHNKAVYFEPASLVSTVLNDVAAMPGALPLLSYALAELYREAQRRRRRSGAADRALRAEDYDRIGGVIGAVQQRASELFNSADRLERASIRRVFLRLVTQEGARVARRRVHATELQYADAEESARVQRVAQRYVDARLLIVDGEFVEPAHDSLVVSWPYLNDWLADGGSQELMRALWRQARDWEAKQRDSGVLWDRDPRLALLPGGQTSELNALEREFADASIRRKTGQRRLLIGTTAAVIFALSTAAVYSWIQQQLAERREAAAVARNIATAKPMLALAEATATMGQWFADDVPEVRSSLLAALQTPKETAIYSDEGMSEIAHVAALGDHAIAAALDPVFTAGKRTPSVALWNVDGTRLGGIDIGAPVVGVAGCATEPVLLVLRHDGCFGFVDIQYAAGPGADPGGPTTWHCPEQTGQSTSSPAESRRDGPPPDWNSYALAPTDRGAYADDAANAVSGGPVPADDGLPPPPAEWNSYALPPSDRGAYTDDTASAASGGPAPSDADRSSPPADWNSYALAPADRDAYADDAANAVSGVPVRADDGLSPPPADWNSYAPPPALRGSYGEAPGAGESFDSAGTGAAATCTPDPRAKVIAALSADCSTVAISRACATDIWRRDPEPRQVGSVPEASPPRSLALDRHGRVIARGYSDGVVRWATATLTRSGQVGIDDEASVRYRVKVPVLAVAVSPDGQHVAGSQGDAVRLWRRGAGVPIEAGAGFFAHQGSVTSLGFDPAGSVVVSGSRDNTLRLSDLQGNALGEPLRGHDSWIRDVAVMPDGLSVLSASNDGSVRRWSMIRSVTAQACREPQYPYELLGVAQNGQTRLVARQGHGVFALDGPCCAKVATDTAAPQAGCAREIAAGAGIWRGALTPDGRFAAYTDLQTRAIRLVTLPVIDGAAAAAEFDYPEPSFRLRAIAVSADGAIVAVGGHDGSVWLWHRDGGSWTTRWAAHRKPVTALAFDRSATRVASGSEDNTVVLTDIRQPERDQVVLNGHQGWVSAVAFSHDGSLVASGSWDNSVRLWDSDGNAMGKPLSGHRDWIAQVAFGLGDAAVISYGNDGQAGQWQGGDAAAWLNAACAQLTFKPQTDDAPASDVYRRAQAVCAGQRAVARQ